MTPARQTGPETATIRCEACQGSGYEPTDEDAFDAFEWRNGQWMWRMPCSLCSGTGREPATVQPREPK